MEQGSRASSTIFLAWVREAGRCTGRSVAGTERDCPYGPGQEELRQVWLLGLAEGRRQAEQGVERAG